jgi:probable HAF family extracellular repeat protein
MKRTHLMLVLVIGGLAVDAATGASFYGLGDLGGSTLDSSAWRISADGSTVVGEARNTADVKEAFVWTATGGMMGLGNLSIDGPAGSSAWGVSADGSVVTGYGLTTAGHEAFRWTAAGGMVALGDLPGGAVSSRGMSVSADGSVIAGRGSTDESQLSVACVWPATGGIQNLGDLPGGIYESRARHITPDGKVVVGYATSASGAEAFRWTQETGMQGLGDLPGGGFYSWAAAASSDGQTIVGLGSSALGHEAFRWTEETGMQGLGTLAGAPEGSAAKGIAADGSIIVGHSGGSSGAPLGLAFIWDETHGMRNLKDVLVDECDLDLSDWQLNYAMDVSADGRVIVGFGTNPSGEREAWVATIPEPATLSLLAFGGLAMLRRKRKSDSQRKRGWA